VSAATVGRLLSRHHRFANFSLFFCKKRYDILVFFFYRKASFKSEVSLAGVFQNTHSHSFFKICRRLCKRALYSKHFLWFFCGNTHSHSFFKMCRRLCKRALYSTKGAPYSPKRAIHAIKVSVDYECCHRRTTESAISR